MAFKDLRGCPFRQPLAWCNAIILLLVLYTVSFAQEPRCSASEPNSITYSFGVQVSEDARHFEVTASFDLLEAITPEHLGIIAFYNGVQIDTLDYQTTLVCGQQAVFRFAVEAKGAPEGFFHAFPRWLPIIPNPIMDSSPDYPLSNAEAFDAAVIRMWLADISTTVLGERPHFRFDEHHQDVQLLPDALQSAYLFLFLDTPEQPTYVTYLEAGQVSLGFQIYFGETASNQLAYTITCLHNDRQFPAFHGAITWSGNVPEGYATIIDGQITDLTSGWHKIQCYVLNNLVHGVEGRVSEWPHKIYPMFIHVP
jgi:hypothetical protein